MNKFVLFIGLALMVFAVVTVETADECPLSSEAITCSPKCISDNDCLSSGKRCCRNICNEKSCVYPKSGNKQSNSGYKGSGGTGTYCGNTKCNPGEKCDMDKTTKRMQCKRG